MAHYRDYPEYLATPMFKAIRATAMRRSNGKCACGELATEVHHTQYPPWGAFDGAKNLVPICHPCHCETEGKEK